MILVRRSGRIRTFFTIRQYTITKWNLQLFFTGFSVEYEEFLGEKVKMLPPAVTAMYDFPG